ncbi:conserved Plasmodium membrane protein, unknown function [Plasmodium knowlesi strain H]|uniref:Transporter n=3 Tax=Plasmodium knowlesi TaxID=5850 RepID=A0A5K1UH31_PLAKH|nr:transporter, putative [Plasmodium knowlesi strain H]OTN66010.1 Uncharacterized protein PKNOH_S100066000 [Plasmodium knowlesi]CAA9988012.1 transporter, putative [Plasmodium knowlesi strain H]SBO22031.1 conserved Plasmodium membrane protein, unknown function [Plasmodium knowlesi strain H]SBO29130.1 conserved Plasmodium membrane protein, unknown function [Plasmodium knowlesi strain H]VVS77486.1 transporter, putative [Plasmodium knowlesi strain H]|eukprot:XP_002258991.1 hypothetical protein, conserved in Plasmodium species [Plasmodium knowlesi strain H]
MDSYTEGGMSAIHREEEAIHGAEMDNGVKTSDHGNEEYEGGHYDNAAYHQGEQDGASYQQEYSSNAQNNQGEEGTVAGGYPYEGNYSNNLNKNLLRNVTNKKKKNKYEGIYNKGKGEMEKKKGGEKENTPYCSFNNFEGVSGGANQEGPVGEILQNGGGYGNQGHDEEKGENPGWSNHPDQSDDEQENEAPFNQEKLKKIDKKKKKMMEKVKRKKKENVDDKKFSEVYNSIYENLKKKKGSKKNAEDHYGNKNDFYEINYASSDQVNSTSSIDDDSLFSDDVLKKYIIGQVLNIIRTSFHWAITSFMLFTLFEHFSVFYVYRMVSFLTLLLFTPISIYLVKWRSVKFFLIATNTVRLVVWGFCVPFLYTLYRDEIKKYNVNRFYEFLFTILLLIDNVQVNISNLIDIDNNGIDFLSKKYHLKINERSKRKFLTLHQFFFDASFIVVNPLIIFVMYLFSNFFSEPYLRDVFIYLSSFIFAVITIISLVVYTLGLEEAESTLKRSGGKRHSTCLESQVTADESVDDMVEAGNYDRGEIEENDNYDDDDEDADAMKKRSNKRSDKGGEGENDHHRDNEDDFEKYYARHSSKEEKTLTYSTYPNIYNDQTKKYLTERSNIEYEQYNGFEQMSLKSQYKKQFNELLDNILRIKNENKLLFYICSLSFLNSVEDIMILMLIPLTSIYVCEFFYINNIFVQLLIAVILISLTKCFENISYYSNKKNIIALKDIFIGIILSGASLLFFFFPFLMINHLNIYSFLIFYIFCCLFYFFFSTNLKTTLSRNLQKYVRESKSDIYNFVGLFMSFMNLLFVILTIFFLSMLDNFVINYVMICFFLIVMLGFLYGWATTTLKDSN